MNKQNKPHKEQNFNSDRTMLRGSQLVNYKNSLILTDLQKDVIIGTLLGDSSMSLRSGRPHYSIKFEQGEMHKDYIYHLYNIFLPYTGSPPSMRFIDRKKTRKAYWFRTYRHEHLMYYYHLFYEVPPNPTIKVKIVPENIKEFLTPRAVAYWFMDDGTFHTNRDSKEKFYLFSTQGFQKYEVQRLCDALKYNFNIRANVAKDKQHWRIYIFKESSVDFKNLILPHLHQSFLYKL